MSAKDAGLKWGMIIGLLLVIFSVFQFLIGEGTNQTLGFASYIFIGGGFFLAFKEFKEGNEGYMKLNEGIKIAAIASAIYALMNSVFFYVYVKMIDASILDEIADKQYEAMEDQGMSPEEIDQAMDIASAFMSLEVITFSAFFLTLIFGLLLGILVAAIVKKNPPENLIIE